MSKQENIIDTFDLIVQIRNPYYKLHGKWKEDFVAAMLKWGFTLENEKLSNRQGFYIGGYQFVEIPHMYNSLNFPDIDCPFIQQPLGYYCVKFNYNLEEKDYNCHLIALIKESMGLISSTKHQKAIYYPCIKEAQHSIDLHKYAFDDGAILLSRDDKKYLAYVIEKIRKQLRKHLYDAHIGSMSTSHNPIRYSYFFRVANENDNNTTYTDDKIIWDQNTIERSIFRDKVTIWTFNFDEEFIENVLMLLPDEHIRSMW